MDRINYGIASSWLTADQLVNEGRTYLYGLVVNASADGGVVTLYDGHNTNGRLIGVFDGFAAGVNSISFPRPLCLETGLYVDVGSNVTGILVEWLSADIPLVEQV